MVAKAISDAVIGKMRFNAELDWYEGSVAVDGQRIKVRVSIDDSGQVESHLNRARVVLGDLDRYSREARKFACDRLLALKNTRWLEEGERPLGETTFCSRLKLSSISVDDSGELALWYDDGDLFWGHSISVTLNESNQCVDAEIRG